MNDKVSERITNRFEESAGQDFSNKDYIRVIQYEYFTQKHFKNEIEHFLVLESLNNEQHMAKNKIIWLKLEFIMWTGESLVCPGCLVLLLLLV